MSMTNHVRLVSAIMIGMLLVSCASDNTLSPDAAGVALDEAAPDPRELTPAGTEGLVTYDESIPDGAFSAFEFLHDDLKSISDASEIVFIGRVTDYVEAVVVAPPDPDDAWNLSHVYDGIVFTVHELLAGEPADASRVTVATFALVRNSDGTPRVRISASPIEVVRSGIEQRNLPHGPRYLVYARHHTPKTSVLYRPDLYFFNTSGGVAEILSDGSLGVGANPPFARVAVETDGVRSMVDHGLLLSDALAAVGIVNEDTQPSEGGPVADPLEDDFTPGGNTGGSPADDPAPTVPSPG